MNKITFLWLFLVLISCNSGKKEVPGMNNAMYIPVYSFEEFESFLDCYDDTIYVINFWATWCVPCVKELPLFQELNDTHGKYNVKVLLVSLDFPENIESQLIPFIKKHQLTPEIVLLDDPNENEWIPEIDTTWSGAIPATLIYQNNRRVFFEQSFTRESLFTEVENFLKI